MSTPSLWDRRPCLPPRFAEGTTASRRSALSREAKPTSHQANFVNPITSTKNWVRFVILPPPDLCTPKPGPSPRRPHHAPRFAEGTVASRNSALSARSEVRAAEPPPEAKPSCPKANLVNPIVSTKIGFVVRRDKPAWCQE